MGLPGRQVQEYVPELSILYEGMVAYCAGQFVKWGQLCECCRCEVHLRGTCSAIKGSSSHFEPAGKHFICIRGMA